MNTDTLLEKDKLRYQMLRRFYDASDGRSKQMIYMATIANEAGIDEREAKGICEYLEAEGLIESLADQWIFGITHAGIIEVESSIRQPEKATDHFSPQVIQYQHFYGTVGAVQNGNNNTASVNQQLSLARSEAISLINQLRQELGEDSPGQKEEALALLNELENEAQKDQPSKTRVNAYLKPLVSFVRETSVNVIAEIGAKILSGQIGLPS